MNNQFIPILLNLLAALFGASGQFLYKKGAARIGTAPLPQIWEIWLGAFLFCAVTVLFLIAFRLGGRISVTYPMYATTFFWGALISARFGGDSLNAGQMSGIALILIGVGVVGFYAKA